MLKALLKKQFLELNQFYFQNKKTGKHRSRAGVIGMVAVYALIFLGLAAAIGVLAVTFAEVLLPMGLDWLYFAMLGLLAVFLGVFGGVFNTYATLYNAKDNELLLSMPIPPSKILLTRMVGVYAMGLMYEAIVFVPAVIVYWIMAKVTALTVIFDVLLVFLLGLFVLTLTCVLGWVVALISSKIKNKSFITVLASLVFFAAYYVFYFRLNAYLSELSLHVDAISSTMRGGLYPFYALGLAASGRVVPMLLVTLGLLALFVLTYYILSRSFRRIVTANRGAKKAVYREKETKISPVSSALLKRELKHFAASPTYMLNCGLGILMMPLAAIAALIKMGAIRELLPIITEGAPEYAGLIPVGILGVMILMCAMNDMTAPSVSLEGRSLWIVQSLPVAPMEVLNAKLRMHQILTVIPAVLCGAALCFVLKVGFSEAVILICALIVYIMFSAALGLVLNLKNPNLTWTNEAVPVKQSMTVLIMLLGGMLFGMGVVAIYYFLAAKVSAGTFLTVLLVIFALLSRFLTSWLRNKGAVIFKNL